MPPAPEPATAPPQRPRASGLEALALLVPLALAVAGYARSLDGALQFDDLGGLVQSRAVRDVGAWLRATPPLELLLTGRPLTTLTFAGNYAAGRLDPFGFHLVNLALHLVTALLAFAVAARLAALAGAARPRRLALAAAGLFAVHPLQSQAVAYVSQRAELLAAALFLAALLALLSRPPGARPWGRWTVALLLLALGFTAKPTVVTLPAAFLLAHLAAAPPAAGGRPAWRDALLPAALLGALAALLAAALVAAVRGRPEAGAAEAGVTPWLYLLTQAQVVLVYLRLLLWPAGQSVEWAWPISTGLRDPATLAAVAAVLALAGFAAALLWRGRRAAGEGAAAARLAGLGLLWFLLVLAPTSSVVPLADALVEHRTYLANLGAFLALAAGGDWLAARLGRPGLAVGAWAAAVALLAAALAARTPVWRTREALWRDALERAPGSFRVHNNLGTALDEQGRLDEAIREYQAALPLAAGRPRQEGQALLNLGVAQLDAGRPEEARRTLEAGLRVAPEPDLLLVNLALIEGAAGNPEAAEALARRALAANPAQASAHVIFGHLALERGDWQAALASYDRAVALDPDRGEAHHGRALVFEALERWPESCGALRDALRASLRPELRAGVSALVQARCR